VFLLYKRERPLQVNKAGLQSRSAKHENKAGLQSARKAGPPRAFIRFASIEKFFLYRVRVYAIFVVGEIFPDRENHIIPIY